MVVMEYLAKFFKVLDNISDETFRANYQFTKESVTTGALKSCLLRYYDLPRDVHSIAVIEIFYDDFVEKYARIAYYPEFLKAAVFAGYFDTQYFKGQFELQYLKIVRNN